MRAWRWPALVLVPVALLAATVVSNRTSTTPAPDRAPGLSDVVTPTAAPAGSLSSTWYCAGGTATGAANGTAEQVVSIANAADRAATAQVTVYPSEGAPVARAVAIGPLARVDLRLSDVVAAPYAAALIEVDGGEVAVQQQARGPAGRSIGPCSSNPASSWYFPAGTSRPGANMVLSLFNPFPNDAVVDVTFEAEDGNRSPQNFQGLVVPRGRVLPLDASGVVTLRDELATRVTVRSGRIVADQLQVFGEGSGLQGLSVVAGAPRGAGSWVFPDGIGGTGYRETFTVYNPSDQPAQVDVQLLLDNPEVNGVAEPFNVTVGPGRYQVVDVHQDGRVPPGVAHSAVVISRNGVPVVAERTIIGEPGAAQVGVSFTMGAPVVATDWIAPVGAVAGASSTAVIIMNPSTTDTATVTVSGIGGGRTQPVAGADQVRIAPGQRQIVDLGLDGLAAGRASLRVTSDNPVAVETRFGFAEGNDLSYVVAVPVGGSVSLPDASIGSLSSETVVLGGD